MLLRAPQLHFDHSQGGMIMNIMSKGESTPARARTPHAALSPESAPPDLEQLAADRVHLSSRQ